MATPTGGHPAARLTAAVSAVVTPVVAASGLDCEEVRVRAAGRRTVVRVVVDADGGVTADELAEVSRAVSRALDDDDPFGPGSYTLEVSTPGVDRPLTQPRHWERATGRLVTVHLREGAPREGRLRLVTDSGVVLGPADSERVDSERAGPDEVALPWADITRGQVQVEFGRREDSHAEEAG